MLGHSSLNVTAAYLQFNDQDIKELVKRRHFRTENVVDYYTEMVRNVDHMRTIILKNERQSKRDFIQSEFLLLAL